MNEAVASDPYRAPSSTVTVAPAEGLLAAYIGPRNTDYYLQRFERFKSGGSKWSWHWPAFFVTGCWLLYRKMWLLALAYLLGMPLLLGLVVVIAVVAGVPEEQLYWLNVAYYGATFLLVPWFANWLYYRHAQTKVEKISAAFPGNDERAAELARIGGTSYAWMLILIVGVVGVLAAIAIPAYQDYTIRAQVSEGLNLSSGAKAAVAEAWEQDGALPADNLAAGLPAAADMAGAYVSSVHVSDGSITVIYGGEAHDLIDGTALVLEPSPSNGTLEWSCWSDSIEARHLPTACR